jgi:hypothetical protein
LLSIVQQGAPENLKHNTQVFQTDTYMDFVFVGLYWTAFVLFARVEDGRWSNWVIGFISVLRIV